jgi:hypothetical protein
VSRLRENLTSGSDGEGLETGHMVPRQSFTRQRAFFNLESNGFNTRDTHLDKPKRIEMMVFILFACYYFSVITGYLNSLKRRIPVKNHGYKATSLFLSGRRFLCGLLNKYIISSQSTVIERLNYILGSIYLLFKKNLIQNHVVKLGVL